MNFLEKKVTMFIAGFLALGALTSLYSMDFELEAPIDMRVKVGVMPYTEDGLVLLGLDERIDDPQSQDFAGWSIFSGNVVSSGNLAFDAKQILFSKTHGVFSGVCDQDFNQSIVVPGKHGGKIMTLFFVKVPFRSDADFCKSRPLFGVTPRMKEFTWVCPEDLLEQPGPIFIKDHKGQEVGLCESFRWTLKNSLVRGCLGAIARHEPLPIAKSLPNNSLFYDCDGNDFCVLVQQDLARPEFLQEFVVAQGNVLDNFALIIRARQRETSKLFLSCARTLTAPAGKIKRNVDFLSDVAHVLSVKTHGVLSLDNVQLRQAVFLKRLKMLVLIVDFSGTELEAKMANVEDGELADLDQILDASYGFIRKNRSIIRLFPMFLNVIHHPYINAFLRKQSSID